MLMVQENTRRTGRRLGMVVADARHPPVRGVDVVLLDVPCTGTGTLARHPDARWRLEPGSIATMVDVQRQMLEAASDVLGPGGLLVYSTCTLEPEENVEQIDAFLAAHADFGIESTGAVPAEHLDERGLLVVTPRKECMDGAFAARMRRAA